MTHVLSPLEAVLPLRKPSHLSEAALAGKILSVSEGILGEVFTNEGTGTLIVDDIDALPAHEQHAT